MRACIVKGCKSQTGRQNGTTLHHMPPLGTPKCNTWLKILGVEKAKYKVVPDYKHYVCSNHFEESAFETDYQTLLLGLKPRPKILKPEASPVGPGKKREDPRKADREEKKRVRARRLLCEELLKAHLKKKQSDATRSLKRCLEARRERGQEQTQAAAPGEERIPHVQPNRNTYSHRPRSQQPKDEDASPPTDGNLEALPYIKCEVVYGSDDGTEGPLRSGAWQWAHNTNGEERTGSPTSPIREGILQLQSPPRRYGDKSSLPQSSEEGNPYIKCEVVCEDSDDNHENLENGMCSTSSGASWQTCPSERTNVTPADVVDAAATSGACRHEASTQTNYSWAPYEMLEVKLIKKKNRRKRTPLRLPPVVPELS